MLLFTADCKKRTFFSVVHSQTVEVQGIQHEVERVYNESYTEASILIYEVDGSKKKLIKTISDGEYSRSSGYDVTNNYLYYANHDNYVMRMSFDTYEIENISIQTDRAFEVTDDDSIICVSVEIPELSKITSDGIDLSTFAPALYDLKTGEEIETKGFPIDSIELGMYLYIEYNAELNGFTIEYKIDSPDPVLTGYISLDDFTFAETHLEMERPYSYYSRYEVWDPMLENQ